jgi:tRNA-specific 2-thiouridylase
VAAKPESQEICFVPDGDYAGVLSARLGADHPALSGGPLVSVTGESLGEHNGYARFTIGQRRGLPGGFPEPMYVVEIRPTDRAVVVGPREALLGSGVVARQVNWLVATPPGVGDPVYVRVRHRAPLVAADVVRIERGEVELALDEPVAAISAGQSLVVYDGRGRVLGGGFIEPARRPVSLPVLTA